MRNVPDRLCELSVPELWRRIEARLAELAPSLIDYLAPPANEEEIAALERDAGHPLPADYKASLREHAGWRTDIGSQGRPYARTLVAGFTLPSPAVVIATHAWLTQHYAGPASAMAHLRGPLRPARYDVGWLPVVEHDEDRSHFSCLDLVPTAGGTVGQIVSVCTNDPDHHVSWPNFHALLAGELLDRLEHGVPDLDVLEDDHILVLDYA